MVSKKPRETKARILEAASRLFYAEGIRAVSVDLIAEKAGVTKKTLYYHFDSKDTLIAAHLTSRDQPNLRAFQKWFREAEGDLPSKVQHLFKGVAKSAKHPKWRGCGFLRTAGELVNMPGHPAIKAGAVHKKNVENWLADQLREKGCLHADQTARQVIVLMDGVFAVMMVHFDTDYIEAAGEAAATLVRTNLHAA
ncbi:MAG: helix-turn-helix domain-containing protein [Sneathiella sp.]